MSHWARHALPALGHRSVIAGRNGGLGELSQEQLPNSAGKLYIGLSENADTRLEQRNTGISKGTKNKATSVPYLDERSNVSL